MRDHTIQIRPFTLLDLMELESRQEVNEHGWLHFKAHIHSSLVEDYQEMSMAEQWIQVVILDEAGQETTIFHGIVCSFSILEENQVFVMEVTAKTGTYLMDLLPHIRTYQEKSIPYDALLDSFTRTYPNAGVSQHKGKGQAIGNFILQYLETDWEFAKRMASNLHTVVIPDHKSGGVRYYFGMPEREKRLTLHTTTYSLQKRVDEYAHKKGKGLDVREQDALYFSLRLRDFYALADCIELNGYTLFVEGIHTVLDGGELYHTYTLKTKNGFLMPRWYNLKAIGISLDSSITFVQADVVQITVALDENKDGCGVRFFPFSTVYSSVDGTGWYCMPEIGDAVRLYVPIHEEEDAYVISATHLESESEIQRVNPDNKSLMNKTGKEVLLTPDSMILTNNAGTAIEMFDGMGIRIVSPLKITIESQDEISISSSKSYVEIVADKEIKLSQSESSIKIADNIDVGSAKINLD